MYKVIFCGTPIVSTNILKALSEIDVEIVGVISQPDRPVGRKKIITPTPVKEMANELNIKVLQPEKIKDSLDEIKNLEADFLITCAYGQIIPQVVLDLFKNCINVHASLLPKYRGGSPIQYAVKNGDRETGITLMKMVKAMDAGEMYVQESIGIDEQDDSGAVFDKIGILGYEMIKRHLISILNGAIVGTPQNEGDVTLAFNMIGEQEKIDWTLSSNEIVNFIRCMSPQPIAYTLLDGERWKIKRARVVGLEEKYISTMKIFFPGEIINIDKEGIFVQTGDGIIKILEIQRPGKKMVSAGVFNDPNAGLSRSAKFN